MFNVALIIDPYYWLKSKDPQYDDYVERELDKLPPVTNFLMCVPRPYAYWKIWSNKHGHPHEDAKQYNLRIMSHTIETAKRSKTPPYTWTNTPVPGRVLVQTKDGLHNLNAVNDAIDRMLSGKAHPVHHVTVIDPRDMISANHSSSVYANHDFHDFSAIYGYNKAKQLGLNVNVVV